VRERGGCFGRRADVNIQTSDAGSLLEDPRNDPDATLASDRRKRDNECDGNVEEADGGAAVRAGAVERCNASCSGSLVKLAAASNKPARAERDPCA
jgi:hypothetical protein